MGKVNVLKEEKAVELNIVRYFEYDGNKYIIFRDGDTDENDYVRLCFAKITEPGVAKKIDDEKEWSTEWSELKDLIKTIVKESKLEEVTSVSDLDEKELENLKIESAKPFKLSESIAELLGSNINFKETEETKEEPKVEEKQDDFAMPSFELPKEEVPSFGETEEKQDMPSFELPKEETGEEAKEETSEFKLPEEEKPEEAPKNLEPEIELPNEEIPSFGAQEEESKEEKPEKEELKSFELPEEEVEEKSVEEDKENELPEEEVPSFDSGDSNEENKNDVIDQQDDPYTKSINEKLHTLEELLGEVRQEAEESVEQPIEQSEEPVEQSVENNDEDQVKAEVQDDRDATIEDLKRQLEQKDEIINQIKGLLN